MLARAVQGDSDARAGGVRRMRRERPKRDSVCCMFQLAHDSTLTFKTFADRVQNRVYRLPPEGGGL